MPASFSARQRVMVIYVAMGVGFGLLLLSTPLAIVAFIVLPLAVGVLALIPALADVVPWVDLLERDPAAAHRFPQQQCGMGTAGDRWRHRLVPRPARVRARAHRAPRSRVAHETRAVVCGDGPRLI